MINNLELTRIEKVEVNKSTISSVYKFNKDKLNQEIYKYLSSDCTFEVSDVGLYEAKITYEDGFSKVVNLFNKKVGDVLV